MAASVALVMMSTGAMADERCCVYNWSDYIAPDTLENFQRTGIKVVTTTCSTATKCWKPSCWQASRAMTSSYRPTLPGQTRIKAGVFQKLDKSKLSNWQNLDVDLLRRSNRAIRATNTPSLTWQGNHRLCLQRREGEGRAGGRCPGGLLGSGVRRRTWPS